MTPKKNLYPPNCGACKHFNTDYDKGYYGDVTAEVRCGLGYWRNDIEFPGLTPLAVQMRTAVNCADFEIDKS